MSAKNLEIELKFSLQSSHQEEFLDQLKHLSPKKLISKQLFNTYFETADGLLRQHDCGLRIRGYDEKYEMTLKTAALGPNGLLKRNEYNYYLKQPKLDLDLFPQTVWPQTLCLNQLKQNLQPQFTTDFKRTQCLIEMHTNSGISQIEVALDIGLIYAGDYQEPLCEVELELKEGPLDGLFSLAKSLLSSNRLKLSELTKAARGYRLYHCQQNHVDPNSLPFTYRAKTDHQTLNSFILEKLFCLEESFLRNMLEYEDFIYSLNEINKSLEKTNTSKHKLPPLPTIDSCRNYLYSEEYNLFKLSLLESLSH